MPERPYRTNSVPLGFLGLVLVSFAGFLGYLGSKMEIEYLRNPPSGGAFREGPGPEGMYGAATVVGWLGCTFVLLGAGVRMRGKRLYSVASIATGVAYMLSLLTPVQGRLWSLLLLIPGMLCVALGISLFIIHRGSPR